MSGFADENIYFDEDRPFHTQKMLTALKNSGYRTAVLTQTVDLVNHISSAPFTDYEMCESKYGLNVYTRLTAVLSEQSHIQVLSQDAAKSYDLVAVQPQTDKLFRQCCGSLDIDIIALDMTQRLPFYLRPPQVRQATDRGIHFEILYSPMIADSTARRHIISTARDLVNLTKGKNIIISSGAAKPIKLRGPYDIINLGLLFGLNEGVARKAILDNCRATLLHARVRNATAKGVVSAAMVTDLKSAELWKLEQQKDDVTDEHKGVQYRYVDSGSVGMGKMSKRHRQSEDGCASVPNFKKVKLVASVKTNMDTDQQQTISE
ncbi:ribonuclease P protein subunit p30-like [Corticium candelabrum]|uniref:ribonuclease P protein subunit p30-like n=1 Tax=Corticium candelabrum TaxID=121492 RepID=UPI002E259DC9|nr:ribonuclease P protein subunit p30-like [Corticium candelabrum]